MEFFKSSLSSYFIIFCAGFLACLYLTKSRCVETPTKVDFVDTGGWVEHHTDTIYREVPKPYQVIKKVSEVPHWLLDSLTELKNESWYVYQDSLLEDTITIPINHYEDSVTTSTYTLKWTAETFGFLTSMIPEVTTIDSFRVVDRWNEKIVIKRPKWVVSTGVSNRLNYKISAGYKGWLIESEFNKSFNFNQIYLTKQFTF